MMMNVKIDRKNEDRRFSYDGMKIRLQWSVLLTALIP